MATFNLLEGEKKKKPPEAQVSGERLFCGAISGSGVGINEPERTGPLLGRLFSGSFVWFMYSHQCIILSASAV